VIEKALKIDPNERWQSAAEMREGLRFSLEAELKPKAEPETRQAETLIVAPVHYEPATSPFHPPEAPKEWIATTPVPGSGRGATDQPGLSISERKPSKKIRNLVGAILGLLVLACGCAGGYMLYLGYLMNEDNPSQATKIILATSTTLKVISPTAISQDQSIKMGLLAPLTGPVPDFGKSVQQGAQLAVKEWNARGGVLGKKIDLLVVDSQCQADPAVAATNKLINQEGVRYLIGEVCSNASIPVSEIVNQKKVVQISPTSTNVLVTVDNQGNTKPFTFRACFIDSFQGLAIAKFARGMGYETAIVIYDPENEYVRGLAEEFQKSFPALGGSIVGSETYSASDTDFSAILEKVAASKAHVLYVPDYYPIINLIASQIKDRGIRVALMGGDGWDSKELDIEMIDAGYYSNHYDSDDTRANVQEWIKRYGLEYKDENANPKVPDAAATLAYDATNLLLEAIQKTGLDDTNLVVQTLEKMRWEGVTGVISFDHQHNPIKPAVVIAIQGGKKVYVKSVEP
jgi:branched-chain amino acid transport system substrate-binding protein